MKGISFMQIFLPVGLWKNPGDEAVVKTLHLINAIIFLDREIILKLFDN